MAAIKEQMAAIFDGLIDPKKINSIQFEGKGRADNYAVSKVRESLEGS